MIVESIPGVGDLCPKVVPVPGGVVQEKRSVVYAVGVGQRGVDHHTDRGVYGGLCVADVGGDGVCLVVT